STKSFLELEGLQIKADVVFFTPNEVFQPFRHDIERRSYQHTFTEAAISCLIHEQYGAADIIIEGHLSTQSLLPYASELNVIVYHEKMRSFTVRSGFTKWKPADSAIQIQDLVGLKVEGLKRLGAGNYITKKDGFYRVEFEQDHCFISEENS